MVTFTCEFDEDSQEHLLSCEMICNNANLNYYEIFGQNIKKQKIVAIALKQERMVHNPRPVREIFF